VAKKESKPASDARYDKHARTVARKMFGSSEGAPVSRKSYPNAERETVRRDVPKKN
jgi:hypothetical protein